MASLPTSTTAPEVAIPRAEASDFSALVRLLLGPLAALAFWSFPVPLEPLQHKALAIMLFMVVNWIAEPIDHGLTALLGCYLFWALGVAKFSVAFSGFINSTVWFLFCSLLMAEATARTGLAKRLGYLFMVRVSGTGAGIQTGLIVLTFVLTFFVPSGLARIGLLASLALGVIKATGSAPHGNLPKSLFLTITTTGGLMDVMVLSGATSMMTRAMVEEQAGIEILWSQWLLACLPLNILTMFATIAIVPWLYPSPKAELGSGAGYFRESLAELGPWSSAEKKVMCWFGLAIALWASDFLHHVSPAVIGIGIGLALCLPKIGVLDAKAAKQINFFVIIFSAGAIGTGAVLLDTQLLSSLNDHLAVALAPFLANAAAYTLALYFAAFLYHFIFANRQTMLITSLPLLISFASAQGLNVTAIALLWTLGGGGGLFIYQSGVYVLGYSYGCFTAKDFFKVSVLLMLVQAIGLAAVVSFYWPWLGLSWR